MPAKSVPQQHSSALHIAILFAVSLLLRILSVAGPYYVDGPRHIRAIQTGRLVIQPPGYFAFNLLGSVISHALHLPAAVALQALNIFFSIAGVAVFYLLARRVLSNPSSALWIAVAYSCSPVVWFASEIHSTYAAMTLFTPLLLLAIESGGLLPGWTIWAVMFAVRPSDGAFVLPWLLVQSRHFPSPRRLAGAAIAAAITAAWWIPTAKRLGGTLLSPLLSSRAQAAGLAQGPLAGHITIHAFVNELHVTLGIVLAWGLLTPALCLAVPRLMRDSRFHRFASSMLLFIAPGLIFFALYFFSDALYLAYAIAPGMLLAALFLERTSPLRTSTMFALASIASLLFMVTARPSNHPSRARAVLDAYLVRYSVPSLKEQRASRLAQLVGSCTDAEVRGQCR